MDIPRIIFTNLSGDRHLRFFHPLGVVNNAALNMYKFFFEPLFLASE